MNYKNVPIILKGSPKKSYTIKSNKKIPIPKLLICKNLKAFLWTDEQKQNPSKDLFII